jgi:glucose-6-phosphate isomerase
VDITTSTPWKQVLSLAASSQQHTLAQMFAADVKRASTLTMQANVGAQSLLVDVSKQNISSEILSALLDVVREAGVEQRRDAMFSGAIVNNTEQQPALHVALRSKATSDVSAAVAAERKKMTEFANGVRNGTICGATGKTFTHVVNVGIGGSDLGPRLVWEALSPVVKADLQCRFVSNIDPLGVQQALQGLDAERTLVVMCSKTFSTSETLANSRAIAAWLESALGADAVAQHCVVVAVDAQKARAQNIAFAHSFAMWQWVGGRYSVPSAVNLCNVVAFGPEVHDQMLDGMRAIDEHFVSAPLQQNIPMVLGAIGVWNRSVLGRATHALISYSDALASFAPYVQQLEMESNGKRVRTDGTPVSVETAPVIWGGVGTNSQHAYMQLLHQGTSVIPVDFIGFAKVLAQGSDEHDALVANMLAQSQALAFGRTADGAGDASLAEHRAMPGNRPSTTIIASQLSAATLGALIALYEHSTFVQGCIWDINSFDQWGVEHGKQLAATVAADIAEGSASAGHDSSTKSLLDWYLKHR